MITWDILVTSIPHRHDTLLELLTELDKQVSPWSSDVQVILYRDNLELPYGDKTQALLDASDAGYVSCIDDDDLPAPDYVEAVMGALRHDPDYVGFNIRWTQHGEPRRRVVHSLACGGWHDHAHQLERDIAQFNPIRRSLARLGEWSGGWEADRRWSEAVRASGKVKTEVYLDQELYFYRERPGAGFQVDRRPLLHMPPLPTYPWLKQIGPYA